MLRMKCILTLALFALCVTVMAVPAMAVAGDDVAYVEDDTDLPTEMVGGSEYDAMVTIENTGTNPWIGDGELTGYSLWSMEGPTDALTLIDRWGIDGVAVEEDGVIAVEDNEDTEDEIENQYAFEMTLLAPPWITLAYDNSIGPTEPPVADSFECGWMMSVGSAVFGNDKATADVVLAPFTDVASTGYGDDKDEPYWAFAQIAQCAATATKSSNFIVQGYGNDTYQPSWVVTRGQMAVFVARAAGYTDDPPVVIVDDEEVPDPSFRDVGADYWAYEEIERCVTNDVVKGYADYFGVDDPLTPEVEGGDAYLPTAVVDRAQMAVYIQRAAELLTTAYDGAFEDIVDEDSAGWWAADSIQACVDAEIVQGYPYPDPEDEDATIYLYRPDGKVTRAQMAVFVWRALVARVGSDVVLAGPGALDPTMHDFVDPGADEATAVFNPGSLSSDYYGWTEADLADDEADRYIPGPGAVVYIVLDGVRVGAGDVEFRIYHMEYDEDADEDVEVEDYAAASQAVTNQTVATQDNDGNCYVVVTYQVPAAPGAYTSDEDSGDAEDYFVEITLPQGAVFEIGFAVEQP